MMIFLIIPEMVLRPVSCALPCAALPNKPVTALAKRQVDFLVSPLAKFNTEYFSSEVFTLLHDRGWWFKLQYAL